ncbi:thymidylate kinase [Cowpox virus]|uniref:Thymidylate kinase n=1 Tax=Cowpox virus TaxID=10243 RepID=A0A0K2YUZ1_COWPX|nr:thymidylate kinase [Cowpox virus]SNB49399.1 thymidylate kinase [Cowpox virus]SPN68024.1 thymidylate kinase [Cowpox virus]
MVACDFSLKDDVAQDPLLNESILSLYKMDSLFSLDGLIFLLPMISIKVDLIVSDDLYIYFQFYYTHKL